MSQAALDPGLREACTPDDPSGDRVVLGGVAFDNLTMGEAISRIAEFVEEGHPRMVVTPNVDHVLRLQHDASYARLVAQADLVLVDSQPLVGLSHLLGRPLKQRVAGSDLFPRLCGYCARAGYTVFFMGGDPGTADAAAEVLTERYPDLKVVGTYCPPHGFETSLEENWRAVEAVRRAQPDIVFVGLGSPKQENWIAAYKDFYDAPVSVGIGISFSFVAGRVPRAPLWMQRCGLEWLHRLASEPRRLFGRYLVRGWAFLPLIARELWNARRQRTAPAMLPEPVAGLNGETVVPALTRPTRRKRRSRKRAQVALHR